MPWPPWEKRQKSQTNGTGSSSSNLSRININSNSGKVTDITSVSTPPPAGSAPLSNAESSLNGLQTPSDALAVSPTALGVAPGAHVQSMFQHASNIRMRKPVFNIFGSSHPPSSDPTNFRASTAAHVAAKSYPGSSRASGSASLELDLPANPIPTPQTGPEIYVRYLMTKNRGYPLWIPSPNKRLPATYRASGVGFGDVGILMTEGGFSFLFNVVHDATHPINASRLLPEGFTPFTAWNPNDVEEYEEFSAGNYLADGSLVRMDSGDDRFKTILKSSAAVAAVLMMPEPVHLSILQNIAPFREYVRVNLKSWYRFVKMDLGREINNGEIRVVYGCRKSAAFGIATVSNSGRVNASTELTFTTNEVTGCKYRWHHRGSAEVKVGPSLGENQDILDHDPVINQCLFVSTIDMPLPEADWKSINPLLTSQQRSNSQPTLSPSPHSTSSSGRTTSDPGNSNISQKGQGSNTCRQQDASTLVPQDEIELWPSMTPYKRLFHPSDIIADFLLRAVPHATSVSLCSDDWGASMTDSVDTVATLISNVLSFNEICEDNGMVYLKPNDRGVIIQYLELASPSAIQWLWTEWRNQHTLSLFWSEINGDPTRVLTPSFPEFVETHLAVWNVILSPWMLIRTFPTTARPSHIRIRNLELLRESTDGSFVGWFTLAALSEVHFSVSLRRAPDGYYTLHGDAPRDGASPPFTGNRLPVGKPSRQSWMLPFTLNSSRLLSHNAGLLPELQSMTLRQSSGDYPAQIYKASFHKLRRSSNSDAASCVYQTNGKSLEERFHDSRPAQALCMGSEPIILQYVEQSARQARSITTSISTPSSTARITNLVGSKFLSGHKRELDRFDGVIALHLHERHPVPPAVAPPFSMDATGGSVSMGSVPPSVQANKLPASVPAARSVIDSTVTVHSHPPPHPIPSLASAQMNNQPQKLVKERSERAWRPIAGAETSVPSRNMGMGVQPVIPGVPKQLISPNVPTQMPDVQQPEKLSNGLNKPQPTPFCKGTANFKGTANDSPISQPLNRDTFHETLSRGLAFIVSAAALHKFSRPLLPMARRLCVCTIVTEGN